MKKTVLLATALISAAFITGCASTREVTAPTVSTAPSTAQSAAALPVTTEAPATTSTTPLATSAPATSAPATSAPATSAVATPTSRAAAPSTTTAPKSTTPKTTTPKTTTPKNGASTTTTPSTTVPATATAPSTTAPAVNPVPGNVYPWFAVPAGKLADAWGISGQVVLADPVMSAVATGANELVVAVDSYDLRFATRYTGFDRYDFSSTGAYTQVYFYCGDMEAGGAMARHYNVAGTKPEFLQVTYRAGIRTIDIGCPKP